MINYNLQKLTWQDFEDLCRDIIEKKENITLENFSDGKDGGIDFRYFLDNKDEESLIVQCKHYKNWNSLKAELEKEKEKVNKLKPNRYILMLSISLTPPQKKKVKEIFSPWIKTQKDILTEKDIDKFLIDNENIAKNHIKLWFTSTAILNNLLHNGILGKSNFYKKKILNKKLPLYVENKKLPKIFDILRDNNFVIISGVPGIGKSTLGEIISLEYMKENYEFIFFTDLKDGFNLFNENEKQVLFYDDFLGQSFLNKSRPKNEDLDLDLFLKMIEGSAKHKLIMTTREYILKQAEKEYEKLNKQVNMIKCVIELDDYTKYEKGRILYNHLHYSDLDNDYLSNIIEDKNYLKIIEHRSYNPRLIESLTKEKFLKGIKPKNFTKYFIKILDNPEEIWKSTFKDKITKSSQDLLYLILFNTSDSYYISKSWDDKISYKELQKQFLNLKNKSGGNINKIEVINKFNESLYELEDTFISINNEEGEQMIKFHNPSVRDFLTNFIKQENYKFWFFVENNVFLIPMLSLFSFNKKETKNKIYLNIKERYILMEHVFKNFYSYKEVVRVSEDQTEKTQLLIKILNLLPQKRNSKLNQLLKKEVLSLSYELIRDKVNLSSYLRVLQKTKLDDKKTITSIISREFENPCWLDDVQRLSYLYDEYSNYFVEYTEHNDIDAEKIVTKIVEEEAEIDSDADESYLSSTSYQIEEIDMVFGYGFEDIVNNIDHEITKKRLKEEDDAIDYQDSYSPKENIDGEIHCLFSSLKK